jgi:hypothetical protein
MSGKLDLIGIVPQPGPAGPPPIHPAMLRTRSRIARAMIAAHALAPEQAIAFSPGPSDVAELMKLRKAGVVRETLPGHYWLDLVANHYREQQKGRVRAMWTVCISLVIATLAVLFFYRG